ncbi:DUF3899 domain-containing protein [Pradoshia sp.]
MISPSRKFFILNTAALLIAFGYSLFQQEVLLPFINAYFMIGLAYICIGSMMFVIGSGFFSIFAHNYKKVMKGSSKKEEYISELSGDTEEKGPDMKVLTFSWTRPLIYSGALSFLITFVCSFVLFG